MINIFKILSFIKEQWLGFLVIALCIVISLSHRVDDGKLINIKKDIKKVEKEIDTLYLNNTKIEERIRIIKQKEYDTIRIIDTMSISELQSYFSERYPEKDSVK